MAEHDTPPATLALIPARGGSQSIPKKNLSTVNGVPLVARAIRQTRLAGVATDIVVSTDDEDIRRVAQQEGATVYGRPEEYRHDNTIQEVDRLLVWMTSEWEARRGERADIVLLVYPTSPLRSPSSIRACATMIASGEFDSTLTLLEDHSYLWSTGAGGARPTNYDPATRGPRQKEAWDQWIETKGAYGVRRDLLLSSGCRLGGRIGFFPVDKYQGIDVDSPADLALCNALIEAGIVDDPVKSAT